MIELLTSDLALLVLATTGMVSTTVLIVRDTRAQRARVVPEEVRVQVRRAA